MKLGLGLREVHLCDLLSRVSWARQSVSTEELSLRQEWKVRKKVS